MRKVMDHELDDYIKELKLEIKSFADPTIHNEDAIARARYWRNKAYHYEGLCNLLERRIARLKKQFNLK